MAFSELLVFCCVNVLFESESDLESEELTIGLLLMIALVVITVN